VTKQQAFLRNKKGAKKWVELFNRLSYRRAQVALCGAAAKIQELGG